MAGRRVGPSHPVPNTFGQLSAPPDIRAQATRAEAPMPTELTHAVSRLSWWIFSGTEPSGNGVRATACTCASTSIGRLIVAEGYRPPSPASQAFASLTLRAGSSLWKLRPVIAASVWSECSF